VAPRAPRDADHRLSEPADPLLETQRALRETVHPDPDAFKAYLERLREELSHPTAEFPRRSRS
jgi:hypothetical protein